MYFNQIAVPGLGCLSYVIGCPRAKAMAVIEGEQSDGSDPFDYPLPPPPEA